MAISKLHEVIDLFEIPKPVESINQINEGLINATFRIKTKNGGFILQKINHHIFLNVEMLSNNLNRVISHIRNKLLIEGNTKCVEVVLSKKGEFYCKKDGEFWRVFKEIEDAKTLNIVTSKEQAYSMGSAFGSFHEMLKDFPEPPLHDVLQNFHNTPLRISNLKESVKLDTASRLCEVREQVDFLLSFENDMNSIVLKGKQGLLPKRVIHQDTKLSNILFNNNDEVLAVIDFDTVMPGYLCYDFGDSIRGGLSTTQEDNKNFDKVAINLDFFKSFATGYANATKGFIIQEEVDTLVFGAQLMTYEQAVRFLDDYLRGDVYYDIKYNTHNLVRTKNQISLFKDLQKHYSLMNEFVLQLYK